MHKMSLSVITLKRVYFGSFWGVLGVILGYLAVFDPFLTLFWPFFDPFFDPLQMSLMPVYPGFGWPPEKQGPFLTLFLGVFWVFFASFLINLIRDSPWNCPFFDVFESVKLRLFFSIKNAHFLNREILATAFSFGSYQLDLAMGTLAILAYFGLNAQKRVFKKHAIFASFLPCF